MPDHPEVESIARLGALVGHWSVEARIKDAPTTGDARIDWALDKCFLLWRVTITDSRFPDSLSIISASTADNSFIQHYFDARGVARIYKMTFDAGTWTLLREEPDFTPLDFAQRFTGTIDADGTSIVGLWESPAADGRWRKDFDLIYRRITPDGELATTGTDLE